MTAQRSAERMASSRARSPRVQVAQLARLAFSDLWHERWLAFCAACVLAATLAPLWTLWGLERGVIGALVERQDRDPVMRQVLPEAAGSQRFDAAWFERVAQWPETAFVMPSTRAIANQVHLYSDSADEPLLLELLPTARRDPLLGALAPPEGAVVLLSEVAAQRLKVAPGATLRLGLERQRDGLSERAVVVLTVGGVVPLAQLDRPAALASLGFLESVQFWRDGRTVAAFGPEGSGPPEPTTVYPLFRMYAPSIREVGVLAARLEAEGVSTYTRAREIDATLGLQRNLRTVLGMIGVITIGGAIVALTALQIATVRRKRRDYALLKLTGHGRAWLTALPCTHALAVALVGAALALAFYAVTAAAINAYFAQHLAVGEAAVRLRASDVALGVLAALVISALPALWGGWRASNVEAADELRDH